jgi:hypothetical protein
MCLRTRKGSKKTRYIRKKTHHQGDDDDDDDGEITERVLHLLPTSGIVKATETVRSVENASIPS